MAAENQSLREYVIHLQSRLLDLSVEPPLPPPGVNLGQPHAYAQSAHATVNLQAPQEPEQVPGPVPNTGSASTQSLDAVAQAVQNLSRSEGMTDRPYKTDQPNTDDRTDEELTRQLQQVDGLPALPTANM